MAKKDTDKTPTVDIMDTDLDSQVINSMEKQSRLPEMVEDYTPVNQLSIPDEARAAYSAKGYELHWVRVFSDTSGTLDMRNIQKKEAAGYTFVKRSEIPGIQENMSSMFSSQMKDSTTELYIVGDLALAKISKERVRAKRKYIEEQTRARNRAIIDDLRKNRVMPDESRGEEFRISRSQPNEASRNVDFGD